jgi:hypothetical protein
MIPKIYRKLENKNNPAIIKPQPPTLYCHITTGSLM